MHLWSIHLISMVQHSLYSPGILLNFIGYLSLAYHRHQDKKFCNSNPTNQIRTGNFILSMIGPDYRVTLDIFMDIFTMFMLQRNKG